MPHKIDPPPARMLRRTLDRVLRASFSVTSTSYGLSTPRLLSSSVASRVVGASFSSSSMISTAGAKIPVRRGNAQNNRFSSFASASPRSRSVTPAMPSKTTIASTGTRSYASSQKVKMSKTSTKIKGYSSWKSRFSVTASGLFRRKQKGKSHMGFSKTPKQRRQLRGTKLVDKTLERPMRKLGFNML